ncbi:MAG: exosortase A [Alphaproteobacteria bacterium]
MPRNGLAAALPSGPLTAGRVSAAAAILGVMALIAIYSETAASMLDLWSRMHAFDHAFLILPVCGYLIWERRRVLAGIGPSPSIVGAILLAGFGIMWIAADAVDVAVGRQAALIGMVESLVLTVVGWRMFRAMLFPMLFLWLVLPTDLNLLPPLQRLATIVSSQTIAMMGIPVFVEDVFIELPAARFWVAPGCAGLNFLLSGLALSILYAEQMYTSWTKRILCVAVAIIVALIANWLRIIAIILASFYLDGVYDINDHYMEGWLFFAAIMFLLMWLGWRFRDPAPVAVRQTGASGPRGGRAGIVVAVAGAVAIAGLFPAYSAYRQSDLPPVPPTRIAIPETVGAWRLVPDDPSWRPNFADADAQATAQYSNGTEQVSLFVAYYAYQGEGREVASYANKVHDDNTWFWLRTGKTEAVIGDTRTTMTTTALKSGDLRRNVWHTYWLDGRYMNSPVMAKLAQAKTDLLFGDRRAGFLAVSADEDTDPENLRAFLAALPPFPTLSAPVAR